MCKEKDLILSMFFKGIILCHAHLNYRPPLSLLVSSSPLPCIFSSFFSSFPFPLTTPSPPSPLIRSRNFHWKWFTANPTHIAITSSYRFHFCISFFIPKWVSKISSLRFVVFFFSSNSASMEKECCVEDKVITY